jgi:uncharacterized protein with ATP-grasp and redox domains
VAVLSLLAEPDRYQACTWPLTRQPDHRAYWVGLFREHIESIVRLIRADHGDEPDIEARIAAFLADYFEGLRVLDDRPDAWGELTVLGLGLYRQQVLDGHGFPDPFARVKAAETARAVALYPEVVAALEGRAPRERLEWLARGIFAGNEFDLGCQATTDRYHADGHDFLATMQNLLARPWPEDDFDVWADRTLGPPPAYRKAAFFVDNAGADAVLGCIPLARELAMLGIETVLAANSRPALNDITIDELNAALARLRPHDADLARLLDAGRITTVASGCGAPLIDLTDLSDECVAATRGADLLILEGMGRGVESNRHAKFLCDALHIALIKDPFVARHIGVCLFSPALRFRRARP